MVIEYLFIAINMLQSAFMIFLNQSVIMELEMFLYTDKIKIYFLISDIKEKLFLIQLSPKKVLNIWNS